MEVSKSSFVLEIPQAETPVTNCLQYVLSLVVRSCDNIVINRGIETITDARIRSINYDISSDTTSHATMATGAADIIFWLSFRNFPSHVLIGQLCGTNKGEKRKVARGLKRIIGWVQDWSDITTLPSVQFQDALCTPILLDKRIRHRDMRYILDYSAVDKQNNTALCVADVLLAMLISSWMVAFENERDLVVDTIPAVVGYVKRIRREMKNLEMADSSVSGTAGATCYEQYISGNDMWFDTVTDLQDNAQGFKFTQQKIKKDKVDVRTCGSDNGGKKLKVAHSDDDSVDDGASAISTGAASQVTSSGDAHTTGADACSRSIDSVVDEKAVGLVAQVNWRDGSTPSIKFPCKNTDTNDCVCGPATGTVDHGEQLELQHGITSEQTNCAVYPWNLMQLPPKRQVRKCQQITSLLHHINNILPQGSHVVEFCAGGGYVGIPLAVLRPDCQVTLTDMNSVSLAYAKQRIVALQLSNVKCFRCELSDIVEAQDTMIGCTADKAETHPNVCRDKMTIQSLLSFDVGVTLHACGSATDKVLDICMKANASFVVSPCCYGFIQHHVSAPCPDVCDKGDSGTSIHDGSVVCSQCENEAVKSSYAQYPKSAAFRQCSWTVMDFVTLCSRADRTFWGHDSRSFVYNKEGHFAMQVIDSDRLMHASDHHYECIGTYMTPRDASPKNHILVGRSTTRCYSDILS